MDNILVKEATNALVEAIIMYFTNDHDLPPDIHERTSVFRIAHYLAFILEPSKLFRDEDIKVDVEYNRDEFRSKKLNGQLIYTDLIVHKRTDNGELTRKNILVCEFKNYFNSASDKERINELVTGQKYGYLAGTTINLKSIRNGESNIFTIEFVRRSSELLDYDKLRGEIPLQAFQLANGKNQNVFPRQISSKRR